MPNWGLTTTQREMKPWGLDEGLLKPHKTITDPVHGDVYLNLLESLIVDSPPMQRLRRVRQLGTTHLVYPGATHSRLSHVLGTQRSAQNLLDAVWNSQTNPQSKDLSENLLSEWDHAGLLDEEFGKATVLARLGGLMHDLCHVPLGHTIEDDLQVLDAHDENEARFTNLWSQIDERARTALENADGLYDELRVLIISKDDHATKFESNYPFVRDIVGNTICADLIDYIQRDHHNTGLPLALGHRFLDSFFVVPSNHPHFAKRMVINVDRDGRHREDIITELVKYLRYRYELTERVLTHHAKTAADAMLGKMLELWHDDLWMSVATDRHPGLGLERTGSLTEARAKIFALAELASQEELADDAGSEAAGSAIDAVPSEDIDAITKHVKEHIENEFLRRSDDGILEYLVDSGPEPTARRAASAELAAALQNRNLYKILGHAGDPADQAVAKETWDRFAKDPQERLKLERAAAKFAGVPHGWQVVIWLPHHKMRLKVADVLVYKDRAIAPLSRVEPTSRAIVDQHQRLWAVTVYAPAEVRDSPEQADAVLAYIGEKTALTFHRRDGSVVPSPWDLAVDKILGEINHGSETTRDALRGLVPSTKTADGSPASFAELVEALKTTARENEIAGIPED
jgi:HD superfamily phosphohydrolase